MKAVAIVVCIAGIGIMTSCTKSNEDLIVGKWMLTIGTNIDDDMIGGIWQFSENGTFSISDSDGYRSGTYQLSNETTLYITMYGTAMCQINKLDKSMLQFTAYDGEQSVFIFSRM